MLLSIIIVSYNTKDLTLQTLQSVMQELESSSLLSTQTEIFLVDNASKDGSMTAAKKFAAANVTAQKLRTLFHFIENKENVGFARANNQAIERAQGKYMLLLNSDTLVQHGALEHMVTVFEQHPVEELTSVLAAQKGKLDRLGVLSATLLNSDGSLQRQGGSFPTLFSLSVHQLFLDDIPFIGSLLPSTQHTGRNKQHHKSDREVLQSDWVGGTAMMVRREVFAEVGMLDHNIFMYGEDVEFCMRAKDHHWDVATDTKAQITHLGSASSSSKNALIGEYKGYLYIWAKHKPLWQLPFAKFILRLGALSRRIIFSSLVKDPQKASIYMTILSDVLR